MEKMERKQTDEVNEEHHEKEYPAIKKAIKDNALIIGTERTLSLLKNAKLKEVLLTTNCPKAVREDIERYAQMNGTKITELDIKNDELGAVCKKPFSISVISIKK